MKKYYYYCPKCEKITLMTIIREDKNTSTLYLKCTICSNPDLKEASKSELEKKKTKKAATDSKSIKTYNPSEAYVVGDIVFHKIFNDTGEVVKITKRLDGQNINTVIFKIAGMKKLLTTVR